MFYLQNKDHYIDIGMVLPFPWLPFKFYCYCKFLQYLTISILLLSSWTSVFVTPNVTDRQNDALF